MNAAEKIGTENKTPAQRKEFTLKKNHRHAGQELKADGKTKIHLTARQEGKLKERGVV